MNTFSHCPKCKQPMLNESQVGFDRGYSMGLTKGPGLRRFWQLSCSKSLDHRIVANTNINDNAILDGLSIHIIMPTADEGGKFALWDFANKYLSILESTLITPRTRSLSWKERELEIPFFIPDLSNYDKLLNKLRTCITFG